MIEFVNTLQKFWATWGNWVTVALIPTIITGLSVMPATQPAAGVVQKIWDIIKQILSYLSVATFKDQAGTFQAPIVGGLKVQKQLSVERAAYRANQERLQGGGGPNIPPAGAAMLTLIFVFFCGGCCAWSHTCKTDDLPGQIATNAIDCGKAVIQSQIAHLLPIVAAILTGGSPNWQEELQSLEAGGSEALACALASAAQEFQNIADHPTGPTGGQLALKLASGKAKADEYAKLKNYKTVNVGPR